MDAQSIGECPAAGGSAQPFSITRGRTLRPLRAKLLGTAASALIAAFFVLGFPAPVQGGRPAGHETESGPMSLDRAAEQVRQSTGGRVLGAETINRGDRVLYRIKVLTRDGQVRYVYVEADARR
jgi:hypothetical protein